MAEAPGSARLSQVLRRVGLHSRRLRTSMRSHQTARSSEGCRGLSLLVRKMCRRVLKFVLSHRKSDLSMTDAHNRRVRRALARFLSLPGALLAVAMGLANPA